MQIELKNINVNHRLSQETHAYTATVYVDGVRAFEASNHGTGGPDLYRRMPDYAGPSEAEINAWLAANTPAIVGAGFTLKNCLEFVVGDLINSSIRRKALDRILKSKIAVIAQHKGEPTLFTYNMAPTADNIRRIEADITAGRIEGELVNRKPSVEERALALV